MRKKHLGGRNRVQHREYAVSAADFSTKYELIFLALKLIRMQAKTKLPRETPCGSFNACFKDKSVNTALCLSHSANIRLQPQNLLTECG